MDSLDSEQLCNTLRQELKLWEKTFASQNNGRKAGRDDIKANAEISQKYKEYNKLRDVFSGKAAPQTPSKRTASRKPTHDADKTPKAQQKTLQTTPLKRKRDSGISFTETAEATIEFLSPEGPTMIGPTPQRDGIVLGLFDLLPAETPSKRRAVLAEVVPNVLQTPSKNTGRAESETSLESRARGEKTPQSVSRRFLLDTLVTPQKMKLDEQGTPTSTFKGFSTPAFLRRNTSLDAIDEDVEPTPRPAPWKRRGLGRSLSAMIQSLKKQEEDRLDEEADIMREMEMEAEGIFVPRKPRISDVLVEDSQAPMALGPDRGIESEEDEDEKAEDGLNQNGQPRKVWKKRGQKRQTRRVIMRPNISKPKLQPTAQVQQDESEEEDQVIDTQLNPDHASALDLLDDNDDGSDYASDDSHTPKKRKTQRKASGNAVKAQPAEELTKAGTVKTAARKIKATAHANYRRLKIKSKGGNGGKGRYGRRR